MIGISVSRDSIDGVGERVTMGAKDGLRQAVEAGFRVSQDEVPVDEGELKASGEIVDRGGTITFRYDADHAVVVESGTAPHPITPDEADVLAFEAEDGSMVFTKHVDHPGTDPQPYVQPGFERMASELRRRGLSPHVEGELEGPI